MKYFATVVVLACTLVCLSGCSVGSEQASTADSLYDADGNYKNDK